VWFGIIEIGEEKVVVPLMSAWNVADGSGEDVVATVGGQLAAIVAQSVGQSVVELVFVISGELESYREFSAVMLTSNALELTSFSA